MHSSTISDEVNPASTAEALGTHHHPHSHPRLPPGAAPGSSVRWHISICLDVKMAEGPRSCWFQLTSNFTSKNKLKFYQTQILWAQPAFFLKKKKRQLLLRNSHFLQLKVLGEGFNGSQSCGIAMLLGSSNNLNPLFTDKATEAQGREELAKKQDPGPYPTSSVHCPPTPASIHSALKSQFRLQSLNLNVYN